jgi:hypothetical protein
MFANDCRNEYIIISIERSNLSSQNKGHYSFSGEGGMVRRRKIDSFSFRTTQDIASRVLDQCGEHP